MLKNRVFYSLEQQKGNIVTGGQLASSLGVSRNAIWKAIRLLQDDGNEIVSIRNKGYILMNTNDTLFEKTIRDDLRTTFIGQKMKLLPVVHSTNQYLKELNTADAKNGYVVVANEQNSGRGRRGRTFLSPKGEGIYLSILLKLDKERQDVRLLTICAAVAVSRAIENKCGISAEIKWVNDIFCKGKKVCGILTEAILSAELQELSTVIVGIGINTGSVPLEINDIATSIGEITGIRGIRNSLIAEVLNQFETVYLDYIGRGEKSDILKYYESRLFIIGTQVLVTSLEDSYVATVLGIDDMGALVVKDERGNIQNISTGEIKLKWGNDK
ncbi:MAG: biotin--[acetyl-CoA-carboxylase] ligase [Synergistaceae bacterium]|nr:biotin--[acetyl-CoA-carboxylase] ligase [Synergistaceae bacterium]